MDVSWDLLIVAFWFSLHTIPALLELELHLQKEDMNLHIVI